LHPALRMSVAHREIQPGSAAPRSRRDRSRKLRRLRLVRGGRARGGTVPLVLPRGGHPQSELVRSPAVRLAQSRPRLARRRAHRRGAAMMRRPITVLIAALGGEGGGVLTNWVVAAAARHGLAVQSTSIPGVAQRTGATTYYVEVMPTPAAELGGRRPVF